MRWAVILLWAVCVLCPLPGYTQTEVLPPAVNGKGSIWGLCWAPDGSTLYFTRVNHPANKPNPSGGATMDIWFSQPTDTGWTQARLAPWLNNASDNAVAALLPDGQRALLIGHYHPQIYTEFAWTQRTGPDPADWSPPIALRLNLAGTPEAKICGQYRYTATAADAGRVLLVAVGCADVLGRTNLYAAFRSAQYPDVYAPIVALTDLNTPHREQQPTLAPDGRTLFFASDRPGGLGGLDVYATYRLDNTWLRWSPPVNLGPDLNTPLHEEGYVLDPPLQYAYFLQSGQVWRKGLTDSTRALIARLAPTTAAPNTTSTFYPDSTAPAASVSPRADTTNGIAPSKVADAQTTPPVPPAAAPLPITLYFTLGSAALPPAARATLDSLARLPLPTVGHWQVQGSTCDLGTPTLNRQLAQARAQAVILYLVAKGLKPELVQATAPTAPPTGVQAHLRPTLRYVRLTWHMP